MVASILNAVVQILIWERLMRSPVLMLQPSVIYVDGCQLISAKGLQSKVCMLMLEQPKQQKGQIIEEGMEPFPQIYFKLENVSLSFSS